MVKAFLSYSSTDKDLVTKIAIQLGKNNCHYDRLTFEPGAKTLDEIFAGLSDTDIFVLFISDEALKSDWVRDEITQAKINYEKKVIDRIFPIIIDKNITHKDPRIPDWIKKPYNLRYFDNEVIILKKIKQLLRESNFKKYSHLKELNDLFIGRGDMIQEFERKIVNIENTRPTSIIASSFFEGIGRRTFLKNGLIKTGIIDKWYEPVSIPINAKESIEDFIYKLNFIKPTSEIFEYDFTQEDTASKILIARSIIKKFTDNNEILFVIDDGSIVLPNHEITNWFKEIISDPDLQNQVSICLISKFKPFGIMVRKMKNILSFQVNELSVPDTQIFFIQYLKILGLTLLPEDIRYFLKFLKGIPGQIIYAANLIESVGANEAKKYVQDIEEFDELRALSILDFLGEESLSRQVLIALSKFEIISYDLVYKIFGETTEVNKAIQELFDLTLLFSVSSMHDYLKLNSSISDYINRSRLQLNREYLDNIRKVTNEALSKPLELNEYSDYSEFLIALQTMIIKGITVPSKYLIPSFILKSMVQEYYKRQFDTVVKLAKKVLENETKFDYEIIRETRYWLCLAYCRIEDERFFEEIGYFKVDPSGSKKDYYFLMGFYYRNTDKMDNAEEYFLKVLAIDENHSRTKRELVNVYLRKGDYMRALDWAHDNYYKYRTNILHIQAYFTCLIKKSDLTSDDLEIIDELLSAAESSLHRKAEDIVRQMKAEYDYYIENDLPKAIEELKESMKLDQNSYFAYRALIEMYKRNNMLPELAQLENEYPELVEPEFE